MKTKKSLEQNFFILGFLKTITASDLKIQVWHEAQRIIQSLHLLLLSNSPFFFWKFSAGFVLQKKSMFFLYCIHQFEIFISCFDISC